MRWVAVAVLAAVLGAAGCSTSGSSGSRPASATGDLGDALLDTAALRRVPGMPRDAEVRPISDVSLFKDSDPRAPCGAKVAFPDPDEEMAVSIRSASLNGIQFVAELAPGVAAALVAALVEDTRPGCPPYETRTNQGRRQQVHLERAVDLPSTVADDGHAAVLSITSGGAPVQAAALTLQRGSVLTYVLMISPEDLADETVVGVAETIGRSLPSGGGRGVPD